MSSIKKIVIEVGGVELSLSPEDAKTLQAALNELYPPKKLKEIQYVPSPYPVYPAQPWRWWCERWDSGSSIRLMSVDSAGTTGSVASANLMNLSGSSFKSLLSK